MTRISAAACAIAALLLDGAFAGSRRATPRPPVVSEQKLEHQVLLIRPGRLGEQSTQVVAAAPVFHLEKAEYIVTVDRPFSTSSTYAILLYRRIDSSPVDCQTELCWQYVLGFTDTRRSGVVKQPLGKFSGDLLVVSWESHRSAPAKAEAINPLLILHAAHECLFASGVHVHIDKAASP